MENRPTPSLLKCLRHTLLRLTKHPTELKIYLHLIWENNFVPHDWSKGITVKLPSKKKTYKSVTTGRELNCSRPLVKNIVVSVS